MAKRWAVDWFDHSYPRIIRDDKDGTTLAECKQEIVRNFEYIRDFAKGQMAYYRALKVSDIESE